MHKQRARRLFRRRFIVKRLREHVIAKTGKSYKHEPGCAASAEGDVSKDVLLQRLRNVEAEAAALRTIVVGIMDELRCPIHLGLLRKPVVAADGQTYSRRPLERWLRHNGTSPLTRELLPTNDLCNNHLAHRVIRRLRESQHLLEQAGLQEMYAYGSWVSASCSSCEDQSDGNESDGSSVMSSSASIISSRRSLASLSALVGDVESHDSLNRLAALRHAILSHQTANHMRSSRLGVRWQTIDLSWRTSTWSLRSHDFLRLPGHATSSLRPFARNS